MKTAIKQQTDFNMILPDQRIDPSFLSVSMTLSLEQHTQCLLEVTH